MSNNRLRETLAEHQFAITFELVPPSADESFEEAIKPLLSFAAEADGRVAAVSITDRVRSDRDCNPIKIAERLLAAGVPQPLVHLAGKNRTLADLDQSIGWVADAGLENLLLVTGDRLHAAQEPAYVPYLDSVNAIGHTRAALAGVMIGAAVNPFKRSELELQTQYLKAGKKIAAGANLLIAQTGFDLARQRSLLAMLEASAYKLPVMASVMAVNVNVAHLIYRGGIPGIVISDSLLDCIEREAASADGGQAARQRRLAIQIVGLQLLGYAGAQVSGFRTWQAGRRLLDLVDRLRTEVQTWEQLEEAWVELHQTSAEVTGRPAPPQGGCTPPARKTQAPRMKERARYRILSIIHKTLFDRSSPASAPLARLVSIPSLPLQRALARTELAFKGPMVGCRLCGFCRLPQTQYVCPETCPKGLVNGPCGGSNDGQCEFGDRECRFSIRYRLAEHYGQLDDLVGLIIPPVAGTRGGGSWRNYFTGADPVPVRIEAGLGQPSSGVSNTST